MFQRLRQMLAAPVFAGDDEKTRLAGVLNPILLIIVTLVMAYGISALFTARDMVDVLVQEGSIALVGLALIWLMRRGRVRVAALILCILLWAMITVGNWFSGGIRGSGLTSHFGIVLIAGLLLGGWGGLAFGGLSIVAGAVVLYGENSGLMPPVPDHVDSAYLFSEFSTVIIGVAGLLYLAIRNLNRALKRARDNETAQIQANQALQTLRDSLEAQVAARTRDLERRSIYLEASAEVSQAIVSILDPQVLTREVNKLLVERFDLTQALIFMVDAAGQWLEARVGDDESARPLRLGVPGATLVSRCFVGAQIQLVDDVTLGQLESDHYILDETRAIALLPLITRGQSIGVLSVESAQPGAFDHNSATLLQTLADLVAAAFDNARLFEERQRAFEAEQRAYGEFGREAWQSLLRGEMTSGYSYADRQLTPIQTAPEIEPQQAGMLSIPIEVRGLVIGYVDVLKGQDGGDWTADDSALAKTITEQLGVALDSARNYQDTQRCAIREQMIGEVTSRIRETLDVETMLRTATGEIRQALNLGDLVIRLTVPETNNQGK